MIITRRKLLKSGAAIGAIGLLTPNLGQAATSARREFVIKVGRRQVGESTVALRRTGGSITADINANLNISILGLINFSYALTAREVWQNGQLRSIEARTDNDGTPEFVSATATSGGVQVNGSRWSGLIPGNPATSSFFAADFLTRPVWISTQDGNPLNVRTGNAGAEMLDTPAGRIGVTRYVVQGDMEIDLFYTAQGEWIGSERSLAGQRVSFLATSGAGALMSVWLG
jgi:hypothetical protein